MDAGEEAGGKVDFFVTDQIDDTVSTVRATLRLVSEHAYWYVDDVLSVESAATAKAAEAFEREIYPVVVRNFGEIARPESGNNQRLTILHTALRGAAGYYSSSDEYASHTHPYSNERTMVYMEAERLRVGSQAYLRVLAHELQHAVHWSADHGEESWVNEGLSELASELAGFPPQLVEAFLRVPTTQLNYWPGDRQSRGLHYGASNLFFAYLANRFGGEGSLKQLVGESADGVRGVEAYLRANDATFVDVFADWVVANYLGERKGPYGYGDRDVRVRAVGEIAEPGVRNGVLPQFSASYFELGMDGDAVVEFRGEASVSRALTACRSGLWCWWSNRGDSIDSTLTREVDLTGHSRATLQFWVWYEIEEDWDYAYVEVSTDSGRTWTLLQSKHTTDSNPTGNSYGHAYTGKSEGWVQEEIDLTAYSGKKVLLRFEYVTDDAVYLDGLVIDDISIPEIGYFDDAEDDGGWTANGFARFDNRLPQEYLVQVIEVYRDGGRAVRRVGLDESRTGNFTVHGLGDRLSHAVVVVSPVTPGTSHPAGYRLTVSPASIPGEGGEATAP